MIEEWRYITGFEGLYEISNHGNLRNARNKRLRKLTPNNHGHMVTTLTKPGYRQNIQAHRLVAQAFIPNPENLPCVLHWDDVPSNNHISNLRWLLRRLKVFPNGYYNYLKNKKIEYISSKEKVLTEIKKIYHENNGINGYRSMRVFLERKNIKLSAQTVHKYMNKELKLYSVVRRKKPNYEKRNTHKVFDNLINRDFSAEKINQYTISDLFFLLKSLD